MNPRSACVFVAEDDEDDRFLLARAFAEHSPDCQLTFAEDGLALLDELEANQLLPSLIILDLNMPRLNGLETLAYLRAHPQYRTTPIAILTTSAARSDQQQAQELGANIFITKPIDGATLGQTVLDLRAKYLVGKCC